MGLFLVVAGWAAATYLWGSYRRAAEMDGWAETPCRIESFEIDGSETNQRGLPKYVARATYSYRWNGRDYLGDRIERLPVESSERRKLEPLLSRYGADTETVCHLDPEAPESAVLEKDSKAALYSIWFPCLFVVGGAGMIGSALFRRRP